MTTRQRKSAAVRTLEKMAGGPLTFARLIRSTREAEEWSQTTMARRLGISVSHLCDIEHGRKAVSAGRAAAWAHELGYPDWVWVRLALQDELDRAGLDLRVAVEAA
ncbi:MAG: helix-turn-helix transcriptional regulator [Myxococcota bacterium]